MRATLERAGVPYRLAAVTFLAVCLLVWHPHAVGADVPHNSLEPLVARPGTRIVLSIVESCPTEHLQFVLSDVERSPTSVSEVHALDLRSEESESGWRVFSFPLPDVEPGLYYLYYSCRGRGYEPFIPRDTERWLTVEALPATDTGSNGQAAPERHGVLLALSAAAIAGFAALRRLDARRGVSTGGERERRRLIP